MTTSFRFKEANSPLFGIIRRPIAEVYFQHTKVPTIWQSATMLIDTGADYTLLPHFFASALGVTVTKDCRAIDTQGVGGKSRAYLVKEKIRVKIGEFQRKIPLGFLASDYIPPLLGRQEFFETFRVVFEKFTVRFE